MDVGVIATPAGLEKYSKWIASIEKFIDVPAPAPNRKRNDANTFVWPGFEAVYAPPGRASRSRRADRRRRLTAAFWGRQASGDLFRVALYMKR